MSHLLHHGVLAIALLGSSPQAETPQAGATAPAHFAGVDLFGTSRFTIAQVREMLGADFAAWESAWLAQDWLRGAESKLKLEAAVKELGNFAFVDFAVIQYFGEGKPSYLTIDVVEAQDAQRRIAFTPAPLQPRAALADPGGLIALYQDYEKIGWELLRAGSLPPDEAAKQETFHSVFGFADAKLAPFKQPLLEGAQRHADELAAVLHGDRDEQHRGAAAFLLAFTRDGARVVKELAPECKDPSSLVRNNSLRVFAEMAHHHPEVELPLDVVLDCLDFPTTTDRNKASAILDALSSKPELRERIVRRAGPTLLAMLALEQPNNHDYAWRILKNLSGESYGERDLAAWQQWLDEELSAR